MTADFAGRVALVVGASRGIGAGTARAWAAAGAAVVLAARTSDALNAVRDDIMAAGGRAVAVRSDATSAEAVRGLVDRAMAEYGRLDYAFNNTTAGPMPGPLASTDLASFDEGIATNIRATFLGLKYQIPAIIASGGGAVVNMASVAGVRPTASLGTYVAGKAGIIALTKVAALDYADQGVRVNVVAPGPILTHHLQRAGEQAQRMAAAAVPLGRLGTVDDVAHAVLWLCSAEASFITGATLPIDGGQSAGVKPPVMYRPGEGAVAGPLTHHRRRPTIVVHEKSARRDDRQVTALDERATLLLRGTAGVQVPYSAPAWRGRSAGSVAGGGLTGSGCLADCAW